MTVLGTGSFGCVLAGQLCPGTHVSKDGRPRVTKVTTGETSFQKEVDIAIRLNSIDPRQEHLIYALSHCAIKYDPNIAHKCQRYVDEQKAKQMAFKPSDQQTMYLLEMFNAGQSLPQMVKQGVTMTEEIAKTVYTSIIDGLKLLGRYELTHGDLHSANVLIHEDKGYLIDFGTSVDYEMDIDAMQHDIGRRIAMLTEEGPFKRRLMQLARQKTEPGSISELHQWAFQSPDKRDRSSASASSSSSARLDHLRIKLF